MTTEEFVDVQRTHVHVLLTLGLDAKRMFLFLLTWIGRHESIPKRSDCDHYHSGAYRFGKGEKLLMGLRNRLDAYFLDVCLKASSVLS